MDLFIGSDNHISFFQEAKKQLIEILAPKCSPFIKLRLINIFIGSYQIDDRGFPYCKSLSIDIKPHHGVIGDMKLYWKSKDNTIIFPSDDIINKKITFWVENIPSDEEIQEKFARHEYLWKREKTEYIIDKKQYRFKIKELGLFATSFPGINIKIKSTTSLENLDAVVGNAVSAFNKEGEVNEGENGLIHDFDSKKKKKDVYSYTIDTGSAFKGGVEAILKALNDSDLDIELITLS